MDEVKSMDKDEYSKYLNREMSWIEFNRRVLEEAQDEDTPILERVKFLSIVSSNLDEFISVRVAGVHDQVKAGYTKKDFSGYAPQVLFRKVMKRTEKMVNDTYRTYRELHRQLSKVGVHLTDYEQLTAAQKKSTDQYYHEIVYPVITPMAVDQSRPFPLVHSLGIYLGVLLRKEEESEEDEPYLALIQIPSILSRTIPVPTRTNSKKKEFILLEDLIKQQIPSLFAGYVPIAVHGFRLTRNADLTLNEEGAEDLLEEIEKELRKRRWGAPVRLEVEKGMHPYMLQLLLEEFELSEGIFHIDGPLDLTFFMKFSIGLPGFESLRYRKLEPIYPREFDDNEDMFEVLRQQDVLVAHPFESFECVSDLLLQAAADPDVLAIKMTLYRVSGNSEVVQALAKAAEAGKQVTVVVELKARFDEERNITWARHLEKSGCHVVYGLVGLKTHAKLLLVVRREQNELRRYVHVGTGNYNDSTARLYTDVGLFTCHPGIGEDATALFNEMTGYSSPREWNTVAVAPADLRQKLFALIQREAEWAKKGRPARIIAKMNSLSHQQMVDELYHASQAGVSVDLIVRGVCCLKPGVPGLSENIRVYSIIDRFLEHSRIFYFENGGTPEVWISSADWMTRNLTRRIELMCPVLDHRNRESLVNILSASLQDNVKRRQLMSNGSYMRVMDAEAPYRSQFELMRISAWKHH